MSSVNGAGAPASDAGRDGVDDLDRRAEEPEQPLGVVAAGRGLDDLGDAVGLKPGEHERGLHLTARDGELVTHAVQRAAADRPAARELPPSLPSTSAPMARSGSRTRAIGRADSDASPTSTVRNGRPAHAPARKRIVVPELPQSTSASRLAPGVDAVPGRPRPARRRPARVEHSEGLDRGAGARDVLAGGEVRDRALAVGHRRGHAAPGARRPCSRARGRVPRNGEPPWTVSAAGRVHEMTAREWW